MKNTCYKIAVTGGVGSGKSSVCKIFQDEGYFVFYSDDEAKKLANSNSQIKKEIINLKN